MKEREIQSILTEEIIFNSAELLNNEDYDIIINDIDKPQCEFNGYFPSVVIKIKKNNEVMNVYEFWTDFNLTEDMVKRWKSFGSDLVLYVPNYGRIRRLKEILNPHGIDPFWGIYKFDVDGNLRMEHWDREFVTLD